MEKLTNSHWSAEFPSTSGFYWYRENRTETPKVVEFDAALQWIYHCGLDTVTGSPFDEKITGEFWSEQIPSPTA